MVYLLAHTLEATIVRQIAVPDLHTLEIERVYVFPNLRRSRVQLVSVRWSRQRFRTRRGGTPKDVDEELKLVTCLQGNSPVFAERQVMPHAPDEGDQQDFTLDIG